MRILLADDQSRVRFALRILLQQHQGLEVIAEAIDAHDLMDVAEITQPDLILLDWELPGRTPEQLLGELHETCPHARVLAMSGRPEAQAQAISAGADAFVSKAQPPEVLLAAIAGMNHNTGAGSLQQLTLRATTLR
jgi:DNA-binding NarL/FixJ family response regulator